MLAGRGICLLGMLACRCIVYCCLLYRYMFCTVVSTAVSLFVYSFVGGGITRMFRPWTHTSDDSYIYQLSLVVATATVSFVAVLVETRAC